MGTPTSFSSVQPRFSGLRVTLKRDENGQLDWKQAQLDLKEADMAETWKRKFPHYHFRKEDVLTADEIRLTIPIPGKVSLDMKAGDSPLVGNLSKKLSRLSKALADSAHLPEQEQKDKLAQVIREEGLSTDELREDLRQVFGNADHNVDFRQGSAAPFHTNGIDGWKNAKQIFKDLQPACLQALNPKTGKHEDGFSIYGYQNHTFSTIA